MSDIKSRLSQVAGILSGSMSSKVQNPNELPWNPENEEFPKLGELPSLPGAPEGAAWVWGEGEYLGRINLLTPTRVKAAAAEIRSGERVPLNLPLNEPSPPAFGREPFEHTIKPLGPGAFDDKYSLNTQSSTQWDGFRHVGHPSGTFYNHGKADDIKATSANDDVSDWPSSLHHIAEKGIATRAILLDYASWAQSNSSAQISPFQRDTISLEDLFACAKAQGLNLAPTTSGGDVRPGDILLIRIGFTAKYRSSSKEEWTAVATRDPKEQQWAGIDGQSDELRAWIHDCYFAAVASDAPALEAWPPNDFAKCLHTHLLPLWGILIGEFFDLEVLAEKCRQQKRWTMFFTSSPPNVKGGVGGWPNAIAIL